MSVVAMLRRNRKRSSAGYGYRWDKKSDRFRKGKRCLVCNTKSNLQAHHVWYNPPGLPWFIAKRWPKHLVPNRYLMALCNKDHAQVTALHRQPGVSVAAATRAYVGVVRWLRWRAASWLNSVRVPLAVTVVVMTIGSLLW